MNPILEFAGVILVITVAGVFGAIWSDVMIKVTEKIADKIYGRWL